MLLFCSAFDGGLRRLVNRDAEALNRHLGLALQPLALRSMQLGPLGPRWRAAASEDDFSKVPALRGCGQRVVMVGDRGATCAPRARQECARSV